jgi:hypothetical protein
LIVLCSQRDYFAEITAFTVMHYQEHFPEKDRDTDGESVKKKRREDKREKGEGRRGRRSYLG